MKTLSCSILTQRNRWTGSSVSVVFLLRESIA
jgi:hypothetical protein